MTGIIKNDFGSSSLWPGDNRKVFCLNLMRSPCTKRYNKKARKPPEELVEWEGVGREPQEEQNAELLSGLLSGKWNHPDAW